MLASTSPPMRQWGPSVVPARTFAPDLRPRADRARPFQAREGGDHRVPIDDDGSVRRVGDHHRLQARGRMEDELIAGADNGEAGMLGVGRLPRRGRRLPVGESQR